MHSVLHFPQLLAVIPRNRRSRFLGPAPCVHSLWGHTLRGAELVSLSLSAWVLGLMIDPIQIILPPPSCDQHVPASGILSAIQAEWPLANPCPQIFLKLNSSLPFSDIFQTFPRWVFSPSALKSNLDPWLFSAASWCFQQLQLWTCFLQI